MLELTLQYFGGRGSGSGGESLSNGLVSSINIKSTTDVWSVRHNPNNEPFVDAINEGVRRVSEDFPGVMNDVQSVDAAELVGSDKGNVLGYYGDGVVALNDNFTNIDKMNTVYDNAVKKNYHPSRGDKSGTEAVTYHEMGHALTDSIAKKAGFKDLDKASKKIVDDAYKASKGRGGTKAWAGKISGYAKESYAECVAEAVSDWYCNGNKANSNSKAIMKELRKYI